MPYTYGTPSWRDRIAEVDAVPVARARSSGMAILGKTNLPELAASIGTTNTMFPPTQNPWREGITPGGSSGRSGAAGPARGGAGAAGRGNRGAVPVPAAGLAGWGVLPPPPPGTP